MDSTLKKVNLHEMTTLYSTVFFPFLTSTTTTIIMRTHAEPESSPGISPFRQVEK